MGTAVLVAFWGGKALFWGCAIWYFIFSSD